MKKFIIFILFTSVSILFAETYFVKTAADGGDNANNGLSWENAKAMIEPAVESSAAGDTILVKYGTYLFSEFQDMIEISSNRKMISDDGDGIGWSDAEPDSSLCIIDADEHCRIFYVNGNSVTNETRIKGFKIINGNGVGLDHGRGGGIYIFNASPVIENCWITENVINGFDAYGCGIYCKVSNAIIQDNVISNNTGITDNSGSGYGGGIYCDDSDIVIQYNIIYGNIATTEYSSPGYGGGIYSSDSNATISYNVFYENSCFDEGSGIYRDNGSPEIKNNIFMNHDSTNSDKRAIYSEQTGFNVSYNCYYNNPVANYNTTSTNSVEADPKFTDAGNGYFSLTYESPCIDAGETSYIYDEIENHHKGWNTDIGAFEYTGNRIKKEVTETGELFFGGNVRAKINVTNLNTLTAIDITVHPEEAHSEVPDGVQRWFDITPTGNVAEFDITLSYKDTELNDNNEDYLNLYRWDGVALDAPKPADILDSTQNLLSVNNETAFSQWMIKQNLPDVDEFSGNCLEFDGIDDYVDLGEPENLKLEIFTIACWFKRTGDGITVSTGAGGFEAEPLVTKGRAQADGSNVDMNYFLGIRETDKVIAADFEEMDTGNNHPIIGTTPITDSLWYHATVTYDREYWRLYLNGNLEAESLEDAQPRDDSIQDNAIGSALSSTGNPLGFFKGYIDEVSIWNTALDSIQIREQMHLPLTGLENNLVSYWQFNSESGDMLYDALNENNGDLTNLDTLNCWINSTIPFGGGITDTQTEISGTVNFIDTGLSMYFHSQTGAEISVTRIDTIPNIIPTEVDEVFDTQYWVVNRFGTGNYEADITFALNEDLTSEDEAAPVQIKLYTRSTTADDSWIYLCNANSVNAANNEVTFNGITTFSQFIITRSIPQIDNFSGNCLEFDGTNDYVSIPDHNTLDITDMLTIEAWVNLSNADNGGGIVCKGTGNGGEAYSLDFYNNNLRFYIRSGGTAHNCLGIPLSLNEWHHVVGQYDGSNLITYVDGVKIIGQSFSGNIDVNDHIVSIGSRQTASGAYDLNCQGKIDEVRIWNVARDSVQIRENMHLLLTGFEPELVSYWQFNDDSGFILSDIVSSNQGTLTNMDTLNCWIDSTIPFGSGFADTQPEVVGTVDFTDTGLSMYFNSIGSAEITVTRIDTLANLNPTEPETVLDSQYWVVNRYGAGTFDADLTFTTIENLTEEDQAELSGIKLYTRSSNADTNWVYLTDADSINVANDEVTFEGITNFSQFIICRDLIAEISVDADSLFFDNVLLEESKTDTLWIFNTGNDTLNISSIISDEVQFTTDIITCQVMPGDSCRILVTFLPVEEGTIIGSLTISSNDEDEPTTEIYLEGKGVNPQLTLLKSTDLELVTNNFNSINIVMNSTPAFTDLDGNGLLDLIIGGAYSYLNHYEQDSINSTSFSLVTDFFNSINVDENSTPTFTDLDGDGLLDLIIGEESLHLNHYEQDSINSTSFSYVTNNFSSIIVVNNPAPTFTDLDGDGLLDLIIGDSNFHLYHYEQDSINSTSFSSVTNNFNSIDIVWYSTPTFTDIDGDGLLDLIIGERYGCLNHYEQDSINSISFSSVTDNFNSIDVGSYSAPAFTDLDNNGALDLIIGEEQGNLNHYEQVVIDTIDFRNVFTGAFVTKNYFVKAEDLLDDLIIECTAEFTISLTDDTGFSGNLSISPVNGIIADTIFVRFEPDSLKTYEGNLSHTTTGADTKYITLSGGGIEADAFPGATLNFDGANDYINLGEPENLKLENFTIDCWFKRVGDGITVSTGGGGMMAEPLVTKGRGEAEGDNRDMNYFLGIRQTDKVLAADFEDMASGGNHPVFGTTAIEDSLWYHAAATYNGTTWRLYLNGNLEAESIENATPRFDSIQDNAIGSALTSNGTPSGYFKGMIDEVSIWNTALDSTQIREQIHLNLEDMETGLVSYWQFNENTGTVITDLISENNGTLTNMYTFNCWIDSTIPFGEGFCDTQILTSTGFYDFNDTDFRITLNSEAAGDVVVVSKINLSPNIVPNDIEEVLDDQYWIMCQYGNTDLDLLDVIFKNVSGITENDASDPSLIKLYRRASNSDSGWVAYDTCINVQINGNLNEVIFENITEYGQFLIARTAPQYLDPPQNVSISIIDSNVEISWEAVSNAVSYKIFASDDPNGTFTDVTSNGSFCSERLELKRPQGARLKDFDRYNQSVNSDNSRERSISTRSKVTSRHSNHNIHRRDGSIMNSDNTRDTKSWTISVSESKRFYYVVASTEEG